MTIPPSSPPQDYLLPALLAMDVYHRDVKGGLSSQVDLLTTSIDSAQPFDQAVNRDTGFFAKAYTDGNTIYISYRGTDDGSLDVAHNAGPIAQTLATGAPLRDLNFGYTAAIGWLSGLHSNGAYDGQVIEAIKFYQQVKAQAGGMPIVVVGQSLGGAPASGPRTGPAASRSGCSTSSPPTAGKRPRCSPASGRWPATGR
jgi:hypothetical protein